MISSADLLRQAPRRPNKNILFEPAHAIVALFVLRKLILQTRMRSYLVGLDVWVFVKPFVYFHTSCVRTAKALADAQARLSFRWSPMW